MTTVVLGWDGLDPGLVDAFGVADALGDHRAAIDTIVNPVLETPHTRELWPTLITGVPPAEHGFRVGEAGDSLDWEHPMIDRAADIASHILPHRFRAEVGRHLRNAGADLSDTRPAEYQERGLTTVFDGRESLALALPNYWTARSEALGLTSSRKASFRAFMRVSDEGGMSLRDDAALDGFEQQVWSSCAQKIGAVRAAVERDYDLIWVWLGFLDTIGHIAPAVDAGGLQERAYRQAARWTGQIREAIQPADTLVCVSDHGLQDGAHTHEAFFGAADPKLVQQVNSVTDVRDTVAGVTPTSGDATIRDGDRRSSGTISADGEDVTDQLAALGYING